ncbi:MAG: DUF4124 domain-containing protein [Burkholderiales bacterium]|nr:DUF4124 domain-containing protein [Burkholderiales bacterium]
MNLTRLALLITATFLAHPATAEIYKYVDENGRITYTNVPKRGAKKLDLDPATAAKSRGNAGPASFPKVDNQTQKKRDDQRKQILQEELATEEKSLADSKIALKEGETQRLGDEARNYPKYLDRIKRLKDNVALHERNIEALKKELGEFK